jgi:hypothetical protein
MLKINRVMLALVAPALILAYPQAGSAAPNPCRFGGPEITEIFVDESNGELVISGECLKGRNSFGPTQVFLAQGQLGLRAPLVVTSDSRNEVVAELPDPIDPGDYNLQLFVGQNTMDEWDLTIGAVGPEGPSGPPGPAQALDFIRVNSGKDNDCWGNQGDRERVTADCPSDYQAIGGHCDFENSSARDLMPYEVGVFGNSYRCEFVAERDVNRCWDWRAEVLCVKLVDDD